MIRKIILACLSCLLALAFGCADQSAERVLSNGPNGSQKQKARKSDTASAKIDPLLVGTWGQSSFGNHLIWTFYADGKCRSIVHCTTGVILGLDTMDGSCTLDGKVLTMHETSETWVPNGARQRPGFSNKPIDDMKRLHIRQLNAQTLILVDDELGTEDALSRVGQPK